MNSRHAAKHGQPSSSGPLDDDDLTQSGSMDESETENDIRSTRDSSRTASIHESTTHKEVISPPTVDYAMAEKAGA